MIKFPNAKINLGLHILRKRDDGYHDLDTIFYPVSLHDMLEIVPNTETTFQTHGLPVAGDASQNLVMKAYAMLKQDFPSLPELAIHLFKHIPMGAGLGGGSSDAAFLLMMANKHFQLELSKVKLKDYALRLGSDCPFFIENIPCHALGRGELLTPVSVDLRSYHFVLIKPEIHISTAAAFAGVIPNASRTPLSDLIKEPIVMWSELIQNDFEHTLFPTYPILKQVKDTLYQAGALFASLSGSGSTVYGIFREKPTLASIPSCTLYHVEAM